MIMRGGGCTSVFRSEDNIKEFAPSWVVVSRLTRHSPLPHLPGSFPFHNGWDGNRFEESPGHWWSRTHIAVAPTKVHQRTSSSHIPKRNGGRCASGDCTPGYTEGRLLPSSSENLTRQGLSLVSLYTQGKYSTDRSSDTAKVSRLASGTTKIWIRALRLQSLCSQMLHHHYL